MSSNTKTGSTINPDLAKDRAKCTFDTLELTHLLDGGAEATQKRRKEESFYLDDAELTGGEPIEYLSHKEKYEETVRKLYILSKKLRKEGQGMEQFRDVSASLLDAAIFSDGNPIGVHFGMFIPTIRAQGTEEQKEKWLKRAMDCEIIGTYAQTELGHGTFIRGLETTATYDPKTEEFIVNSPTRTSFKWWPAALGHTSNYGVVLAQLFSLGHCYGVHPFIVQLRDEKTHYPLPGITIGEIGVKFGMNGANNGYLGFNNVRIARDHMLMKNSQILPNGTYVASKNSKLTYGTMVRVRVSLVKLAAECIKKSVTIAVRYSSVRRQSQMKPGEPESQIIEYLTQQYKLYPQIAACFAFHFTAISVRTLLDKVTFQLENGVFDQLPELHALASCLKAITASDAATAVETCRLACGGHGYMICSSLPVLYGLVSPMATYEGENTVLLLQTARSLMKAWSNVVEGKPLSSVVEYLRTSRNNQFKSFIKSIDWIVSVLENIAARKVEMAWKLLNSKISSGHSPEAAWNLTSLQLVAAAEIHARAFIVKTYSSTMSAITETVSQELKTVLRQLLDLYGVCTLLNLRGDIFRFTDIPATAIDHLQAWLEETLGLIRPNAVGIVDSFDMRDDMLSSALGAYDGNVYERLFEAASKSPLNREVVNKVFDAYLKPFMQSKY